VRYIGGKTLLLDLIIETIKNNTQNVQSVIDVFAGSGSVSQRLKKEGYKVYSNDFLYFSYVLNRGQIDINKPPVFNKLEIKDPITYLNNLKIEDTNFSLNDCFIYNNYCPNDSCNRMYFQPQNAIKIDIIRMTIEKWFKDDLISENEYFYLLSSLIAAIPYVSNIAGVYGAYLKFWDKRTYNDLELKPIELISSKVKNKSFNENFEDILPNIKADVLYADPPYNERQYLPNYHILETIAKYDYPEISGISGMRDYKNKKSTFCKKSTVKSAFERMIKLADVRYIVISYNNESLLSTEELSEICKKYAKKDTFKLIEVDYRRYKSKNPNKKQGLKEQIYFFEKDNIPPESFDKSPLNYIGGKYKLLPQITKLFPDDINTMVDLFAGGCDVCTNINAKNIYANDINSFIIDIYKSMANMTIQELLTYIDDIIQKEGLSLTNREAYNKFRDKYNADVNKNPIDLYILMCYAFNHQCRFNNKHEFNTPFGKGRSSFNQKIRKNLIKFHENIQGIKFTSMDFKDFDISKFGSGDFIYADPPYLITKGSYNDGKRGFKGWCKDDDIALFQLLDKANAKGIKFALSNVIEHKGLMNEELKKWSEKYKVHYLNYNYKNCNYHGKNTEKKTIEVLITNY
jgi:adenine-specific DNA-methyltransferase